MTALMWFRRDLRIHDNLALQQALHQHELVVPVYCLDSRLLQGRNRGAARAAFLGACLEELEDKLEELGSGLVILDDRPEDALVELSREIGATEVFAAADVSPFARRRDHSVAASLMQHDASLRLWPGAFAADDLGSIRTGTGGPYSVFTPFHRRWLSQARRRVEPAPDRLPTLPKLSAGSRLKRSTLSRLPDVSKLPERSRWTPGEDAARERLEGFLADSVSDYTEGHDALGRSGTSELSPYLHFGCISPRQIESRMPQNAGADALRRQLCWRDFYAHVLLHNPGNAHAEHQPRLRPKIRWKRSEQHFRAWTEGQTGYPLVDAGMRELASTGWMHNRARMVVGSFLVKDLGIDWRWGERWFMRTLLDGDEANNNGNWQWIASVGVDTQPPSRRILNPTLQQKRFDPDGTYVRTYVSELSPVPDEHLAEPWKMPDELQRELGCVIGVHYPQPIVDHAQARLEAIERYATASGGLGMRGLALASVIAGPGRVLPIAAAAIAVLILLTWLISLRLHDASVIDPLWGPAFVVVALVAALAGAGCPSRRWLIFGMTAAWGLRLGYYITRRKLSDPGEDRRYTAMREAHPENFPLWSLRSVYLVQGVMVLIVALPLQVAAHSAARLNWAIAPGLVVYAIGLGFEAIGDDQLRRFKSDPDNRGKVMDRGLWRYTRHPNYFGDASVWWGLWLVALQAGGAWWTVISPMLMTLLLVRVSGKGLLEKDMRKRRPEYADYIRRTSGFIPLPPRRAERKGSD